MKFMENDEVIEYGSRIVGGNLRYIRIGGFEFLRKNIIRGVAGRFEYTGADMEISDEIIESILRLSAQRLENSEFLIYRIEYARDIYRHIGDLDKARELDRRIRSFEEELKDSLSNFEINCTQF